MKISELMVELEKILAKDGDLQVTYIDNGDFAPDFIELDPQVVIDEKFEKIVIL